MWYLKHYLKRIQRFWRWGLLGWSTGFYDWCHTLEIFSKALGELSQEMENGHHAHPEKHTKRIKVVQTLLKRMQDGYDDQTEMFMAQKHGKRDYIFIDVSDQHPEEMKVYGRVSRLEVVLEKGTDEEYRKNLTKRMDMENKLFIQDLNYLNTLLKKHLRSWWD